MPNRIRIAAAFVAALSLLVSAGTMARDLDDRDLTRLTIAEAARLIKEGEVSSERLTRVLLKKIEANRDLAAFITVDARKALEAARRADAERRRCEPRELGPLHGVPLVVKDNIHIAGLRNTAGTPGLRNFVPDDNAPVAQALLDAGAIILGKTNMHELAFGITSNNAAFGAVRTPYDKTRFAGGSSGGTGSAVAARLAPGGLGTDTGGSVRIPAALNGIADHPSLFAGGRHADLVHPRHAGADGPYRLGPDPARQRDHPRLAESAAGGPAADPSRDRAGDVSEHRHRDARAH
jgi:mandelamide amidase